MWRISSYIICLRKKLGDHKLIESATFLIASANKDGLEFFSPSGDYVGYYGKLIEDAEGECDQYVRIFSSYDEKIIKSTAIKLWYYYVGKDVRFTDEEKKLLSDLGIKI